MSSVRLTLLALVACASVAYAQRPIGITLPPRAPLMATVVGRTTGTVAGVSVDRKLRIWEAGSGRLLHTIDIAGRDLALLLMSWDGRSVLMADYARRVTIWNTSTAQVLWEFSVRRYVTAAAFSRDGRFLAFAEGSPVQIHDMNTRQLVRTLAPTIGTTSIVFSRDAASIATTDGDSLRVYDVASGRVVASNGDFIAAGLTADFSVDGKIVYAAGGDRAVVAIDAKLGKTIRRSAKLADAIFYLEVSPAGGEIGVVTQNVDDPVRSAPVMVAELPSLTPRVTWRSPSGVLLPGAAWTSDGRFLAVTQRPDTLHVWPVRSTPASTRR